MKILTANRLHDGEAVWFGTNGHWNEALAGAAIAVDDEAVTALERIGVEAYENNQVVDVELIDVALADGEILPKRLRERIRAAGPTNRNDLGKQARPAISRAA
jgi:hypothetical protein